MWCKHPVTLHCCPAPHATGACCFTRVSFYLPSLSTLFSHKGESLEVSTSKRDDCQCGSSCGSLTVRTCRQIFSVQSPLVFYPNPRLLLKGVPDFSGSSASQGNAHEPSYCTEIDLSNQLVWNVLFSTFLFCYIFKYWGGGKCMTDIITSLTHFNLFSLQEAALLNQTTYLLMRVAVIIKKKWYWFICCAVFTSMKTNL